MAVAEQLQDLGRYLKRCRYALVAIFFTVLGSYLRLKCFLNRELWIDETVLINIVPGPLKPFWDRHPLGVELSSFPGEYLLLWPFVQIFGFERWVLALPHIFITLLGFYFLYLLCKKYFRSIWGYLVAFALVCFNSQLIFHSLEIRPYSILATWGLVIFYFSREIFSESGILTARREFVIGVLFLCAIGYHASGLLIILSCGLFFYLEKHRERSFQANVRRIFSFYGKVAFLGIPLFLWFATGTAPDLHRTIFEFIPNPLADFYGFVKAILGNLIGNKFLYGLLLGLFMACLLPTGNRSSQIGFFLVIVVLPIQILLLFCLNSGYWFLQRQFIWVSPLFAFFLGWCWDSILSVQRKNSSVVGAKGRLAFKCFLRRN